MHPGVRMSCWPLLKGTFLPLRTPPGWPLPAWLGLLLRGWVSPSKVHPELPRALSAFRHCQAAVPGRQHQEKAQNILISFKWTFLSHTVLSICSILSWKHAIPRGCSSLLFLTPKLLVSSLSLLRESQSQQGHGKRGITSTRKFLVNLQEVGTEGGEKLNEAGIWEKKITVPN